MKLDNIKFLNGATDIVEVKEGYSGATKYTFQNRGKKYFLKIGYLGLRKDIERVLEEDHIAHPKMYEIGQYDDDRQYVIEEFLEGENMKTLLDNYHEKFIYEFGFMIGKQFATLRKRYPDQKPTEQELNEFRKSVDEVIKNIRDILSEKNSIIEKKQIVVLTRWMNYLKDHFDHIKNSLSIYGHTDIKPSNFIISNNEIYATDLDHLGYKELSLSMHWTFARLDGYDEKNLAFARGYLGGLFNLDVPNEVLKAFDYTYTWNIARLVTDNYKDGNLEKFMSRIEFVSSHYMTDGDISLDEKLRSPIDIKNLPTLSGFDFTLVRGSYNPYNMVFCACRDKETYFLKMMKTSATSYKRALASYRLMESLGIPTSHLKASGRCKEKDNYYAIFDFIKGRELSSFEEDFDFEKGYSYGQKVAKYIKRLKGHRITGCNVFDLKKLKEHMNGVVNSIYVHEEHINYIKWPKKEVKSVIERYMPSFEEEPIDLIHADIKFGNLLTRNGKDIVFVDNENFQYSYDIVNFFYNIQNAFMYEHIDAYRGFITAYFKTMNNGTIPKRIDDQIRLLFFGYFLRTILGVLEKNGSANKIEEMSKLCQKYVFDKGELTWFH